MPIQGKRELLGETGEHGHLWGGSMEGGGVSQMRLVSEQDWVRQGLKALAVKL